LVLLQRIHFFVQLKLTANNDFQFFFERRVFLPQ